MVRVVRDLSNQFLLKITPSESCFIAHLCRHGSPMLCCIFSEASQDFAILKTRANFSSKRTAFAHRPVRLQSYLFLDFLGRRNLTLSNQMTLRRNEVCLDDPERNKIIVTVANLSPRKAYS